MPGLLRCTCGDYARVLTLLIAREAAGALGARHSLRPLFCWANSSCKNSGASRRGIAEVCHEYERATPQSSSPGLTGRPSIPETPVMETKGRGVLGSPKARPGGGV